MLSCWPLYRDTAIGRRVVCARLQLIHSTRSFRYLSDCVHYIFCCRCGCDPRPCQSRQMACLWRKYSCNPLVKGFSIWGTDLISSVLSKLVSQSISLNQVAELSPTVHACARLQILPSLILLASKQLVVERITGVRPSFPLLPAAPEISFAEQS